MTRLIIGECKANIKSDATRRVYLNTQWSCLDSHALRQQASAIPEFGGAILLAHRLHWLFGESLRGAMNCKISGMVLLLTFSAASTASQETNQPKYEGYRKFNPGFIVMEGQTKQGAPMGLVLKVDDNPKPHGWYFLAPDFQDHDVSGEWVQDGIVLNSSSRDHLSLTFQREGASAKLGEALSLYNITTLKGILEQGSSLQPVKLGISLMRGPLENGRWYDFGESDTQIEGNAQAFLRAVKNGNVENAAKYVDYPLHVSVDGKTLKVWNREEFLRDYNKIFTPVAMAWIKRALPHDMFYRGLPCDECSGSNTDGPEAAMVLNGDIWFSAKGALSISFSTFSPKN